MFKTLLPLFQTHMNYLGTLGMTKTDKGAQFTFLSESEWGGGGEPNDVTIPYPGTLLDHVPGYAKSELGFTIMGDSDVFSCVIEYSTDLFQADTIARLGEHLRVLISSAADTPDASIRELSIMDEAERNFGNRRLRGFPYL